MKKFIIIISVLLLTSSLTACGSNSTPDNTEENNISGDNVDHVENKEDDSEIFPNNKNEVEAYVILAKKSYSEMKTLLEKYEELRDVAAAKEIDALEFREFLQDEIIPTNSRIAEEIEAIHTPNEQTIKINQLLIDAVGHQQLAFAKVLSSIESGDSPETISANEILNDAIKSAEDFVRKLEQLLIDYNIE